MRLGQVGLGRRSFGFAQLGTQLLEPSSRLRAALCRLVVRGALLMARVEREVQLTARSA